MHCRLRVADAPSDCARTPTMDAAVRRRRAEPATIDGCQVIARIDGQVVLACEVLWRVNQMLEENRDRDSTQSIRSGPRPIDAADAHRHDRPEAALRRVSPQHSAPRTCRGSKRICCRTSRRREVPRADEAARRARASASWNRNSRGSDRRSPTRGRSFNEHVIASEWIRSKIKVNEEVSPEEMVEYYRDHRAEFEFPTQARWEELIGPQERHSRRRRSSRSPSWR